jgi:hypothetical protein
MFFPAADTIAFSEGGTESMRIDASGNVGIGTSSPGARMDVRGSIDAASSATSRVRVTMSGGVGSIVSENAGTQFEELRQTGQFASFYTGLFSASERMRIDASGNVGIGTSSPSYRLDVSGNSIIGDGTDRTPSSNWDGQLNVRGNGYTGGISLNATGMWVGHNSGGRALIFATDETERFRVGPSGQFGVGGANYGTSGQVLTSTGSGSAPSWQSATATGTLLNVQAFVSSGTYTRTAGATRAVVVVRGGGGGGNNSSTAGAGGTSSFGSHVSAAGGGGASLGGGCTPVPGAGGTGGTGALISIRGQRGIGASGVNAAGGGEGGGGIVQAGVRGGGGGGTGGTFSSGGGQGEYSLDYITSGLGATETVTIGSGGSGQGGGGAGGSGYVIVYEYS